MICSRKLVLFYIRLLVFAAGQIIPGKGYKTESVFIHTESRSFQLDGGNCSVIGTAVF